jgi:hypothetical protein
LALSLRTADEHDCYGNNWYAYDKCVGGPDSIIV